MDIVNQYLDFLQNIEFVVVQIAKGDPSLTDKEVIKAFDRLNKFYQRKKKKMPDLESTLTGGARDVFEATKEVCDLRRKKNHGEIINDGDMGDVPINVVIACISRLEKSASLWHKKDGPKGYINYISNFIQ